MVEEEGPTWRYVAIGAITVVFSLVGYLVGNFISNVRDELAAIRQTLDSRAGMATRLDAFERTHADQEIRLRAVEQEYWKQDRKR